MELWIRGQRKGLLIKINSHIKISECNGYYCLLQNEYYLGKYATEERALEVLDDFAEFITKNAYVEKKNGLGEIIDIIPQPILLFDMPQE